MNWKEQVNHSIDFTFDLVKNNIKILCFLVTGEVLSFFLE